MRLIKLALLSIVLSLTACQKDKIPQPVLKLVEQRMLLYVTERDSICKSEAIKKAEMAVDSFFLTLRRQYLHDSIVVPMKPIKPMVDTQITLDNTIPVKPLWDTFPAKK
ncbi:MAG: hypothetical protein KA109_10980 [Saprospiraceae bacterium]|mgnify:CR=1 FL=1|jgi:hypothetical protein|nr:hypothetical protein [Saprospiraceae bacterium]MBK7436257.1 hypothetical protein [Saprospiraceae bacterium]MBK7608525.1 hypothetical protein [Saprospiraceae bacterium]MBK8281313.1 hypothetical protein [Saprospiraceae bacterium]MBK8514383.1 hypothetical protein [Saprospiraceae bacterium]